MANRKSQKYSIPSAQNQNSGSPACSRSQEVNLELCELDQYQVLFQPSALRAAVREGSLGHFDRELASLGNRGKLDDLDSSGFSVLHEAARFNHHGVVKTLLDHGAQIDVQSKQDLLTPLHIAARFDGSETVQLLIDRGADVNLRSSNGSTALHMAARSGNRKIAEILVACHKVEINSRDKIRQTPLHVACANGNKDLCALLLGNGADLTIKSAEGKTPLHVAVSGGNAHVARWLLNEDAQGRENIEGLVKQTDLYGNTLLHLAADTNDVHVAEVCLGHGADINAQRANSFTSLHIAAAKGHQKMAKLLIANGANTGAKDAERKTPLHRASLLNKVDMVLLMLEEGVEVDPRDGLNRTPLLDASLAGQTQCVIALLQHGAKVDASDVYMKNCLHFAVENEHLASLNVLLSNEKVLCNVDRPDVHERVPLHYAAIAHNVEILKALMAKYERFFFRDENQETPLHLAAGRGIVENVVALVQLSGGLNERDDQGRVPLHTAVANGNRRMCSTLLRLGADSNITDINMWSPLMLAARLGSVKCCQELLDKQASVDDINTDGDTALHLASRHGHVPVVNLLMDYNANLSTTNSSDTTFLGAAVKAGMSEVASAIVRHQRWPEIAKQKDRNGHPPVQCLIRHFPEAAKIVMDRSIHRSSSINTNDPEYSIRYDFNLLDPGPDDPSFIKGRRFFGPTAMVKYGRRELLQHPLTAELLKHKWSTFGRILYYLNFFSYIFYVAVYSTFIVKERERLRFVVSTTTGDFIIDENEYGEEEEYYVETNQQVPANIFKRPTAFSLVFSYIVLANAIFHILKEIIQLFVKRLEYLTDITNLLEWVIYVTTVIFMIPYTMPDEWVNAAFSQSKQKTFMWMNGLISICFCYVNLVLFLRRFRLLGIYVTMYVEVTKTMLKVMLVFSVFILGFSIVFFVLFKEQDSFADFGRSVIRVSVMMIGELEFKDTFVETVGKNNTVTKNPLNPFPEAAFSFGFVFLFLMCIVLMNLLVGLAVGDIDSIAKNATLKRLAMQVAYVAEIEETYPRFITRRLYEAQKVVTPNRPSRGTSFLARIRGTRPKSANFPLNDDETRRTDYHVMQEQISKTKKRVKLLVNAVQAQNEILRLIARKIDPEADLDHLVLPDA